MYRLISLKHATLSQTNFRRELKVLRQVKPGRGHVDEWRDELAKRRFKQGTLGKVKPMKSH